MAITADVQTALRDLILAQPKAWLAQARERMRDLPKTNFDLGCRFAEQGKWFDAMFRFRITLMLRPDYPQAAHNLGSCLLRAGKRAEAKKAFLRALKTAPNDSASIFMLASIDPAAVPNQLRPTRIPLPMVSGFFSSIAQGYDTSEAAAKYQGGQAVASVVKPLITSTTPRILDLACGTGIAARPWRQAASSIHGVDVTAAMLDAARAATHAEKPLYDSLIEGDITALPDTITANHYDLVLLVNVAQFIGDLTGVMRGVARVLVEGGVVAITVESSSANVAQGYALDPASSRFTHSPAYVVQTAIAAGLAEVKHASVALYEGVVSPLLLFRKGAA